MTRCERGSTRARAPRPLAAASRAAGARAASTSAARWAWGLARQPSFVPAIGARTRAQLGALDRTLPGGDLEVLAAFSGDRCAAEQGRRPNCERC
ncbi:hypothetical protein [Sorangium sp. So ce385]|uniref:hypothetical protein n=1 Tax=Sorangium sp. So ce385 TaxID=3133308 RepID=UPI003F5BF024